MITSIDDKMINRNIRIVGTKSLHKSNRMFMWLLISPGKFYNYFGGRYLYTPPPPPKYIASEKISPLPQVPLEASLGVPAR